MAADNRIDPGRVFDLNDFSGGAEVFHTVRAGETLESIAELHQVSVNALVDANPPIKELGRIQPGMAVIIPTSTR